jgi:glycosyltransferase involved in cell wall biosynthesis
MHQWADIVTGLLRSIRMSNKIFVLLRTRNEERNIARFLQHYPPENIDKILISDGLSLDRTVEVAKTYPKTYFRPFNKVVYGDNGIYRQPEGSHFQFINNWAKEEGATDEDWLLWDDADSVPTEAMVKDFRKIFDDADQAGALAIYAFHIYIWKFDEYFPQMNLPGRIMYAWKVKAGVYWDEAETWGVIQKNAPAPNLHYNIQNPYALLHYFCQTEEIAQQKYEFYKNSNRMTGIIPILQMAGPKIPLEAWMK